ncbi:DUF6382 domain-containing protein [Paenibacillus sp. y28]|uniref:DUF6382 domain-containing protein n=1 Tax=Paenibacillus sp. y28 TaxID=3129110 RepID=UPI00301ABBD6
MNATIWGFEVDYVSDGRAAMVLDKPQGLTAADLVYIEMRMLQSNPVPGLLPLEFEHTDNRVRLHYSLSMRRMLGQHLKANRMSVEETVRLLMKITDIMLTSRTYMLHPQRFVLDERFIFIAHDGLDLSLTYIPCREFDDQPAIAEQFRQLVFGLLPRIDNMRGDMMQRIVGYLQGGSFDLQEFKMMLAGLLKQTKQRSGAGEEGAVSGERLGWTGASAGVKPPPGVRQQELQQPAVQGQRTNSIPAASSPETGISAKGKKQNAGMANGHLHSSVRSRVVVIAVLMIALVWCLFSFMPTSSMLYTAAGVTVLIADVAFIWVKHLQGHWIGVRLIPALRDEMKPEPGDGALSASLPVISGKEPRRTWLSDLEPEGPDWEFDNESRTKKSAEAGLSTGRLTSVNADLAPEGANYSALGGEQKANPPVSVADIVPTEQTVLLHPGMLAQPFPARREAGWFLVCNNKEDQLIRLEKDSVIIGRDEANADIIDDTVGVSRAHLELVKASPTSGDASPQANRAGMEHREQVPMPVESRPVYYAKDLGSVNGTTLNGETMAPYKLYPLQSGDRLGIVHSVYEVRND